MPDLDAFGMILEGGSGGGSGGGGTSMIEIVDSTTTSKTFTEISGGTVYRFLQPLGTLDIQAMPTDTKEAVVIFEGGATVNRTPVVSVYLPFMTFDYDVTSFISSPKPLPMSATQSGWTYSADSRIWGAADKFVYDSSVEEYVLSSVSTTITSGAISCFSSGGIYAVSASDVVFENTWYYDHEPVSTTSDVVSGVVASSTDGSTWVPVNSTTFPVIYGNGDYTEEIVSSAAPAVSVTSAAETPGPCQVALPASAGIVQMPEFTSGGKYVLSLQFGLAVGAEYEVQS